MDRISVSTRINLLVALATFSFLVAVGLHFLSDNLSRTARDDVTAYAEIGNQTHRAESATLTMLLSLHDFSATGTVGFAMAFDGASREAAAALDYLGKLERTGPVRDKIEGLSRGLALVGPRFEELRELTQRLGIDDNQGLRRDLLDAVKGLEKELGSWPNVETVHGKLQEARRFEQSFILNSSDYDLGRFRKAIRELDFSLLAGPFDPQSRGSIADLIASYSSLLESFSKHAARRVKKLRQLTENLNTFRPEAQSIVLFAENEEAKARATHAEILDQVNTLMTGSSVISLILVIGAGVLVGRTIRHPIQRISRAMELVASGERPDEIPGFGRKDEIGVMAGAIDNAINTINAREDALRESQQRFQDFAEVSADCFWETDPDLAYRYISNPEYLESGLLLCDLGLISGGVRGQPACHEAFREFEYSRPSDGTQRYFLISGNPIIDKSGMFNGYRGTVREVTQRKQAETELVLAKEEAEQAFAELKEAQSSLIQAEKMASLGQLVAGVAHEINTPVGVGLTAASHLRELADGFGDVIESGAIKKSELTRFTSGVEDACNLIVTNLHRAAELIQSFKLVAVDQTSSEKRRFDLKGYIEEIVHSLQPNIKKTLLRIDVECPSGIVLESYPGALSQTLTNLVMNSIIHAYGPGETGVVSVVVRRLQNGMIRLIYADDGEGIPPDTLSHIFEPFFTTKRGSGGSGLGLHVVYNTVTNALGGSVSATSTVGEGTTFTIEIPTNFEAGADEEGSNMTMTV